MVGIEIRVALCENPMLTRYDKWLQFGYRSEGAEMEVVLATLWF